VGDKLPHGSDSTPSSDAQASVKRIGLVLEFRDRTLEKHGRLARGQGAHVWSELPILLVSLALRKNPEPTLYSLMSSLSVPFSFGGEMAVYGLLCQRAPIYECDALPDDWLALIVFDFILSHG